MQRFILPGWHGSDLQHRQRLWLPHDPAAIVVKQCDWNNLADRLAEMVP